MMIATAIITGCDTSNNSTDSIISSEPESVVRHKNEAYMQSWFLMPVEFTDHQIPEVSKEKNAVGPNGNLVYSVSNALETDNNALELDLVFDSNGYSDGYSRMGMLRHTFSSSMDDVPSYEQLRWKVGTRSTAADACVQTWPALAAKAYRGSLSSGIATYNSSTKLCEISVNGEIKLKLPVFRGSKETLTTTQYNQKAFHTVTQGDGTTYVFVRNPADGKYSVTTKDTVKLERVGDTWKFTDAKDRVETFDLTGRLTKVDDAGSTVHLAYGTLGRLISAQNGSSATLTFSYTGDSYSVDTESNYTRIMKVTDSTTGHSLSFVYNPRSKTQEAQSQTYYDQNNKIKEIWYQDESGKKIAMAIDLGTSTLPAKITRYDETGTPIIDTIEYDVNQNVAKITSPDETSTFQYKPERLTSVINDATTIFTTTTDFVIHNSVQSPTVLHSIDSATSTEYTQTASYDANGDLVSITTSDGTVVSAKPGQRNKATGNADNAMTITFSYNDRRQRESGIFEDKDGVKTFRYAYDEKWNRPVKVQKDDEVTMFSYNELGMVSETIKAKLDKAPKDKAEFEKMSRDDLLSLGNASQNVFAYDDLGQKISTTNKAGEVTRFEYDAEGKRIVTIKPDGRRIEKKSTDKNGNARSKVQARAATIPNGTLIDTRAANNQTAFIGGAGDDWLSSIVRDYKKAFAIRASADTEAPADTSMTYTRYYSYEEVGNILGANNPQPIDKVKDVQTVVGHSWGGDSAVEASKARYSNFDLLVTIDPVGTLDWDSDADYWVGVWADPGPQFKWVHSCRKWFGKKLCIKYPKANWTRGDWTAWLGGKFWYSSLDQKDVSADIELDYNGHHEDFEQMINLMESDIRYQYGFR